MVDHSTSMSCCNFFEIKKEPVTDILFDLPPCQGGWWRWETNNIKILVSTVAQFGFYVPILCIILQMSIYSDVT